jgi:methylated-DNA-[protein]-cysteine S-methyltransferase
MMSARQHFQIDRIASPLGTLLVVCDDASRLRALDFHDYEPRMQRLLRTHYGEQGFELVTGRAPAAVAEALAAFFAGALHAIESIEVRTGGTPFQRRVWSALRRIPSSVTHSYGELARAIGKPSAARAVGLANGANPVVIVVPCHRVIGADGSLTGFGGGIERKRWLLEHEQKWRSASVPIAQRCTTWTRDATTPCPTGSPTMAN